MIRASQLARLLLVAQASLLALPEQQRPGAFVQCSSSYIDDYFLPSAKIAFNKIQQQFTPSSTAASAGAGATWTAAPTAPPPPTQTTTTSDRLEEGQNAAGAPDQGKQEQAGGEPNRSDFVNLNVARPRALEVEAAANSSRNAQPPENSTGSQEPIAMSATESVSVDPTALGGEAGEAGEASEAPVESIEVEPAAAGPSATTTTTTTTTTTASSATTLGSSLVAATARQDSIEEQSEGTRPAEEAIRETELEAIAAVDASIGFGDQAAVFGGAAGLGAAGATDACYDEYGNARFCEPEFENVASERQVVASSECGAPPSRFCTAYVNEREIRNCHMCDQTHPTKRHPAAYLTDMHNPNQPTCWVSAPIGGGNASAAAGEPAQRDNVTLTLNLDKRYELTYLSLQFCSLKPDSLAIWKSSDFGRTWTPYQFYSPRCARLYNRPTASGAGGDAQPIEATCVNGSSGGGGRAGNAAPAGQTNGRIAFSTLDNPLARNGSSGSGDKPPALQDWMTATNIRIVLDQPQASWIQSSLAHAHHHARNASPTAQAAGGAQQPQQLQQPVGGELLESSLTNPSDTYNYAISDLTLGGRCKCHGHAARCVHNQEGRLQCDCQHNTDGPDCERCLPLHHDRPWQRATPANANPCQPCNCNGHSRKCRFDSELYQLSGRRSGGVCIDCRDNTAGRHCHYCKEGWTRDHTRPMSDKEACKPCDCHPVGSVGKVCNQTSGQCPCKEGVTGLECNRCAAGYQQSSSPSEPCIKLPENDINYEPSIEASGGGGEEQPSERVEPAVAAPAPADEDPSIAVAQVAPQSKQAAGGRVDEAPAAPADSLNGRQHGVDQDQDEELAARPRPHQHHSGRGVGQGPWARPYNGERNYYASQATRSRAKAQQFEAPPLEEFNEESGGAYELEELAGYSRQLGQLYGNGEAGGYHSNKRPGGQFGGDAYRARGRHHAFGPPPPMSSFVPADDYAPGAAQDENAAAGAYERPPPPPPGAPMNPLYADDTNAFNQIQNSNSLPISRQQQQQQHQQQQQQRNGHRLAAGHQADYLQLRNMLRGVQPMTYRAQAAAAAAVGQEQAAPRDSLACADCQPAARRLNFKQFCRLDYAIKATILRKHMADDWTRFEVEIQDIFKSPSSSALLLHRSQRNFVIDSIQKSADYAPLDGAASQADNNNKTQLQQQTTNGAATAPLAGEMEQRIGAGQPAPIHRALKVGGLHSIWVPTEDVSCNCPLLKARSTYLLMGLVDARDNAAASIQLDRHGVALSWKPSLQKRLITYQRRHSRGRCP